MDVQIYPNQEAQCAFLSDMAPGWSLYQGGLGSGKTWAGARKFLNLHLLNRCPGMIVAPTFGDIGRTVIEPLEKALQEYKLRYRISWLGTTKVKYPHIMIAGQPALLMTAEKAERITGFEVGHAWIEEAAKIKENKFDVTRDPWTQIPARLRHSKAKIKHVLLTTTPEGMHTYVHKSFFKKPKNNYRSYIGHTEKNKELPADYIQSLRDQYPPSLLDQYLKGIAVDFTARPAHFDFTDENIKEIPLPEFPVFHLGCDFNVEMCGWVLGCQTGKGFYVIDEYLIEDNAKIEDMVKKMVEQNCPKRINLHVDKSSKSRNRLGDPEFTVLCKILRENNFTINGTAEGANPEVSSRINCINEQIFGGGVRKLFINPKLDNLIRQLRKAGRTEDNHYDKRADEQYNSLEALGYTIWDLYKPVTASVSYIPGRR